MCEKVRWDMRDPSSGFICPGSVIGMAMKIGQLSFYLTVKCYRIGVLLLCKNCSSTFSAQCLSPLFLGTATHCLPCFRGIRIPFVSNDQRVAFLKFALSIQASYGCVCDGAKWSRFSLANRLLLMSTNGADYKTKPLNALVPPSPNLNPLE